MKRWMILLVSCILGLMVFAGNAKAGGEDRKIVWTIQWKGMSYTGNYSGDMAFGRPNGYGEFRGFINKEYGIEGQIVYSGEWLDGRMEGEGLLTDRTASISYEGLFLENMLNGRIKETVLEGEEKDYYLIKRYSRDVPYELSIKYDPQEKKTGYDCYFNGISVGEIRAAARTFSYDELSYHAKENTNKEIKLRCKVVSIEDVQFTEEARTGTGESDTGGVQEENILNRRIIKVADQEGNAYALSYILEQDKQNTVYVPVLKKGDDITVYGYYNGINDLGGYNLPFIDLVYARWTKKAEPDIRKLDYSYKEFLNYPYLFKHRSIALKGTVAGTCRIDGEWLYIFVDSDTHSKKHKNRYVCRISNEEAAIRHLPKPGKKIHLRGSLQGLEMCGQKGDDLIFYPLLNVMLIM